jgi:hypothetical protein
MNEITPAQRERILQRLREGQSLRSIEAATGHRRETIGRYGRAAGVLPAQRRHVKGSTLSARLPAGSCRVVLSEPRSRRRYAVVRLGGHDRHRSGFAHT